MAKRQAIAAPPQQNVPFARLKDYVNGADVKQGLTQWFCLYTHRRPHQGLGGRTPFEDCHQLPPA